jgi:hypothetical protein
MQFVQRGLLSAQIGSDSFGHCGFGGIGRRDPHRPYQTRIQVT